MQNLQGLGIRFGVVIGMLTMASGCVSVPEDQDPTTESVESVESTPGGDMGTVSQALNNPTTCAYAADGKGIAGKKEAQKRAVQALKYILGNTSLSGCTGFKTYADVVRLAIKDGRFTITSSTYNPQDLICDLPALRIKVSEVATRNSVTVGPVWDALHELVKMNGEVDSCFGTGASTFFVLQTNSTTISPGVIRSWVEFDPSPATLTAALSGTATGTATGAFAAAKYSDDSTTFVYRWPTNGGTNGISCTAAYAGLACTTTSGTHAIGTVHAKTISNFDGTCYCK